MGILGAGFRLLVGAHRREDYGLDVSKKFITAASSQEGEFDTSIGS
jgi:hypothetical protein